VGVSWEEDGEGEERDEHKGEDSKWNSVSCGHDGLQGSWKVRRLRAQAYTKQLSLTIICIASREIFTELYQQLSAVLL
jgi:hypothetical protein